MFSARDAAQNWKFECTEIVTEVGFKQGWHSTCVVYHKEKNVQVVAQGDDFAALGGRSLDWFRGGVQRHVEVKFKGTLDAGKLGAVRMLNRITTVTEHGLECEAEQRHAKILMMEMGIDEGNKGVATPGASAREAEKVCSERWRREGTA